MTSQPEKSIPVEHVTVGTHVLVTDNSESAEVVGIKLDSTSTQNLVFELKLDSGKVINWSVLRRCTFRLNTNKPASRPLHIRAQYLTVGCTFYHRTEANALDKRVVTSISAGQSIDCIIVSWESDTETGGTSYDVNDRVQVREA